MTHPEVLTEAIQTILRRENYAGAYEALRELSRGHELNMESIREFIRTLQVDEKVKKELMQITPENYIGLASKITKI
jgi:adenylosuccinate lyase